MPQVYKDWISALKKGYGSVVAVMLALALVGLTVVGNYGITYDEEGPLRVAFENFKIIAEGKPYPGHLKHYGTLFNVASEVVFQKSQRVFKAEFPLQDRYDGEGYTIRPFYGRLKIKHVLTFLLSLLAYASVAGIVGILAGLEFAWLGPIVLSLFPRFWGHSFFNPKDIPLATAFTLGTFAGVLLVGYFHRAQQNKTLKFGLNRLTFFALGYGVLTGLIAGIRLDGSIVLLFMAIAHLFSSLGSDDLRTTIRRFWKFYGLIFLAWTATTILFYPSSWSNPVEWFWETLRFYYDEDWPLTVLFQGKLIAASNLPWHYLPQWLTMITPELFQATFLLGLGWIAWRYRALALMQKVCVSAVLLQIFFLPIVAVQLNSTIYDEARQFLYILPGVAAISATVLAWLYQAISGQRRRLFAIALAVALASPIIFDMIALHPYEYLYFNRTFGGLAKAQGEFETDYWALSMREGMEWINTHAEPNATVVSSDPIYAAAPFAGPGVTVIADKPHKPTAVSKPFYYVAIPRWDAQQRYAECEIVHQVERQRVPLTIIKKCR